MDIPKLIKADIKDSLLKLRGLRFWVELNLENLTLAEFKKFRKEIEALEILIEIHKDQF